MKHIKSMLAGVTGNNDRAACACHVKRGSLRAIKRVINRYARHVANQAARIEAASLGAWGFTTPASVHEANAILIDGLSQRTHGARAFTAEDKKHLLRLLGTTDVRVFIHD